MLNSPIKKDAILFRYMVDLSKTIIWYRTRRWLSPRSKRKISWPAFDSFVCVVSSTRGVFRADLELRITLDAARRNAWHKLDHPICYHPSYTWPPLPFECNDLLPICLVSGKASPPTCCNWSSSLNRPYLAIQTLAHCRMDRHCPTLYNSGIVLTPHRRPSSSVQQLSGLYLLFLDLVCQTNLASFRLS